MTVALRKAEIEPAARAHAIREADTAKRGLAEDEAEVFERDDGLLRVAGPIMALCYLLLFAVATVTFFGTGDALFAVMISSGFAALFFTIPILMLRIRAGRDTRWRGNAAQTTSEIVDVQTGPIHRWEAIVQIVSIPLAILMGFCLLALRWSLL